MTAAAQLAIVPVSEQQWISAEEAERRTGWTPRWLRAQAAAGRVTSRPSATRAANGRIAQEYLLSSLPGAHNTQLAVVRPQQSALGPLFANLPAIDAERSALTDPEAEAQAEQRLSTLRPVLDFANDPGRFAHLRLADGRPVTSQERMIEFVAASSERSVPTLKRWLAAYRAAGRPALADRIRTDKGQSRWFAAHPKAAWFAAYLHLGDSSFDVGFREQSFRTIHSRICESLDLLGIERGDEPSYETVRNWLKQTPAALETYAHKGRKAYHDQITAYLQYEYTDVYANAWWVTDHALLDVESQNDIFADLPEGAPYRIRITSFMDFRSRKIMGVSFCPEGSSRSLAAALYRGVVRYGLPKGIKADNGKDLRKVGLGAVTRISAAETVEPEGWWSNELDQITTGLAARLGLAVSYALPFHAQGKNIERWHKTLHAHFCAAWPTYTSGSPATRPDATEAAMYRHRKLLKHGRLAESNHPRSSQVIAMALGWIEEYNRTPHTGRGMDGCSPNEVFTACLDPNPRPTPSPADLALLMADRCTREVVRGAVTLDRRRYVPEDHEAAQILHWNATRQMVVAYDRAAPEAVSVLDQDGRFLCRLVAETFMRFAPGDPAVRGRISEHMRGTRGLERDTRDALALVARNARQIGALSPIEDMASRLQLAAGETGEHVITQRPARVRPDKTAVAPATATEIAADILEALK